MEKRLCFGCVREGHIAKNCMNRATCKIANCFRKHPTVLHIPIPTILKRTESIREALRKKTKVLRLKESTKLMLYPVLVTTINNVLPEQGPENPSLLERLSLSKSEARIRLLLRMHSLTMEVVQRSAQSY